MAERGEVHAQIVADLRYHHLARVEADADVEPDAVTGFHRRTEGQQGVADMQGGEAGSARMVLVRDRRTEQRDDPVAAELIRCAFKPVDTLGNDLDVILDDAEPMFGVHPFRQGHGALYVDGQDGDVLAFARQCGTGLTDLVGEMFWGWWRAGGGRRGWARVGQHRAAVAAKAFA